MKREDMFDLLGSLVNQGARIVRYKGKNPNLLLIGENHNDTHNVGSPRDLFLALQPKYFFCEGVSSGEIMNFEQREEFNPGEDSSVDDYQDDSFKKSIWGTLYDFGTGNGGDAVTHWYKDSPKTKFVGDDLPGKSKILLDLDDKYSEKFRDCFLRPVVYLINNPNTPNDLRYNARFSFDLDLNFEKRHIFGDVYTLVDKLKFLSEVVPENIAKYTNLNSFYEEVKVEVDRVNRQREEVMGDTIVKYTPSEEGTNMGILGNFHIRNGSHVYTPLDYAGLDYVAVDISKSNQEK